MTLQEMRDEVQAALGLQDVQDFDETVFVTRWLNRGVIDMLSRTRCVVRCVHLQTLAGVDTYTLDHSILTLLEVENGARRRGRNEKRYGDEFSLIRSDVLRIPTPSVDGEVDVWAVLRPTPMSEDTDSPGDEEHGAIPDEFQDAILFYAMWKGSDYSDDQSGGQGERYRNQYEGQDGRGGRLREIRAQVNKRGTVRASRRSSLLPTVSSRRVWL